MLEEMFSVVYPEYNYRNRDSCTKVKRKKHNLNLSFFLYTELGIKYGIGFHLGICCYYDRRFARKHFADFVWRKRETRTLTSFLFVNMAIADLLIAVFQMPFSMAHFYVSEFTGAVGNLFCRSVMYLVNVSMTASIFSLVVMAFDRYFAVIHPLKRMIWFRRAKIILPVIWIASWTLMAVTPFSYMAKDSLGKCFYTDEHIPRVPFWTYLLLINYIMPLAIISCAKDMVPRNSWPT